MLNGPTPLNGTPVRGPVLRLFLMERLAVLLIVSVLLAVSCGGRSKNKDASAPPSDGGAGGAPADDPVEDPCALKTAWGRNICCGRPTEIVGVSCVDPNEPAPCTPLGQGHDARFAPSHCCEGLIAITRTVIETTDLEQFPDGCDWNQGAPSAVVCTACGDGICARPDENSCNCEKDCPKP